MPFADPKQAGLLSKQLQAGVYRLEAQAELYQLWVEDTLVAELDAEQKDRLEAVL